MNNRVLQRAHELMAQGVPFALATVVRRERPTSGQPGDKAIITCAGEFVGWVGGSCAQPTVLAGSPEGSGRWRAEAGGAHPQPRR